MNSHSITTLTATKLHQFIGHLKLGPAHLKNQLSQKQFKELLKWGELDEEQKEAIAPTNVERVSQIVSVLNTIATSIFGGYMGLSVMLNYDFLADPIRLSLACLFTCLIGGSLGYISVKMLKQKTDDAMHQLKTLKIQLRSLKTLNSKLDLDIKEIIQSLIADSKQLTHNDASLLSSDSAQSIEMGEANRTWLDQIGKQIQQKTSNFPAEEIYAIYKKDVLDNYQQLSKILLNKDESGKLREEFTQESTQNPSKSQNDLMFIKVLTDPAIATPTPKLEKKPWFKEKSIKIILGLVPTLFGTFASLFVIMNGIPDIAKKLGIFQVERWMTHPNARFVEIILMILITVYLGASFLYSTKKDAEREREKSNILQKIIEQENLVAANHNKIRALAKAKTYLHDLMRTLNFLDKGVKDAS